MNINFKTIKEGVVIGIIALLFVVFNFWLFLQVNNVNCDMGEQQNWGNLVLDGGILNLYRHGLTDYPPLYMAILALNSWISLNFFGSNQVSHLYYLLVSKTVPTLCIFLSGLMMFLYLKKINIKNAYVTFLFYIFNIALLYNSSFWGQVDSVYTFLVLVSLLLLLNKRYTLASIFLLLGFLTKAQSIIFIPIIWLIIFIKCGIVKTIKIFLINLSIIIIFLFPFFQSGGGQNVIRNLVPVGKNYPYVTVNAFNFWYLISPHKYDSQITTSDNKNFLWLSFRNWGFILFGTYTLLILYQLSKKNDNKSIVLAMSSMALGFFLLPTEIHERYLFPFFALCSLILSKSKKYILVYLVLVFTYLINLMMIMGFDGGNTVFYRQIYTGLSSLINTFSYESVAISISIINLIIFIYFLKIGIFNDLTSNIRKDIVSIGKFKIVH